MRLTALFLLAISFCLMSCSREVEKISVAGNQWIGYHPLYAIHELTSLTHTQQQQQQSNPINITRLNSIYESLRLLANGQLDASLLPLDDAVKFQAETQMDLCIPLVLSYSNGADGFLIHPSRQKNWKSIPLKVAVGKNTLALYMAERIKEIFQLPANHLQLITLPHEQHRKALKEHRVDASITFSPYKSMLLADGALEVFNSNQLAEEIIDVVLVNKIDWEQKNQSFDILINELWPDAYRRLEQKEKALFQQMQQNTQLSQSEYLQELSKVKFFSTKESQDFLQYKLATQIKRINKLLLNYQLIPKAANIHACPIL